MRRVHYHDRGVPLVIIKKTRDTADNAFLLLQRNNENNIIIIIHYLIIIVYFSGDDSSSSVSVRRATIRFRVGSTSFSVPFSWGRDARLYVIVALLLLLLL